jgi:hypothetical protein
MPHEGGTSSLSPGGAKPEPDQSSGADTVTVLTGRLDDILPRSLWPRVAMVKLDIEGAEVAALRGAAELLRSARPALLVEVVDDHLTRQGSGEAELADLLAGFGYLAVSGAAAPPNVLFLPA